MPAINLLIQTLTEPGDQVIIQTPVFYPFYHAVEFNNRQLVRNALRYENGHYSIDFDFWLPKRQIQMPKCSFCAANTILLVAFGAARN